MTNAFSSTTPTRLRRQITSVLVAVSLTVGMVAAMARPAHAADYIHGCFRSAYGMDLWDTPMQVWAHSQNNWYVVGVGKIGRNGCQYWHVPANYRNLPLLMVVNYTMGGYTFSGATPKIGYPGQGQYQLGIGVVTRR
jgi:hypothetical protein